MNPNPLAAANMVNQLFNAGDPDQYKRELVQNAIHAGATDIEAGAIRLGDSARRAGSRQPSSTTAAVCRPPSWSPRARAASR